MTLTITSPAFQEGARIPKRYTRDGENLMPPLHWTGAPRGVRSYALIIDDPDAPGGTFGHAAVMNIPAGWSDLGQDLEALPGGDGVAFGRNDFGNERYDGPEPPRGHGTHRYHFRLAALDVADLGIRAGADIRAVRQQARKHMIEEADLVGTYER